MAVVTIHGIQVFSDAYRIPGGVELTGNIDAFEWTDLSPPQGAYDAGTLSLSATLTRNEPIELEPQAESPGWRWPSFFDDFYNRILVLPAKVNVGNLITEQQYPVEVWNGFFYSRNLENIQVQNGGGISLSGDTPPSEWVALQGKIYQLTVVLDGPSDINAKYLFDFDGVSNDVVLSVVGSRVVALFYPFGAPARETLEWKTDLMLSNDGTEQRVRLRKKPRQGLSVRYPIPQTELARAENLVYGWVGRRWGVGVWSEAQQIGTVNVGSTVINIDTTTSDYRVGALLLVWESNRRNATADIESITAGSITLNRPLEDTFVNPWVMPMRIGHMVGGSASRSTSGHNGTIEAAYEFVDNVDLAPSSAPVQFLGYDVYFDEVLKQGEVLTDTIYERVDVVDYGTAKQAGLFSPWINPRIKRPHRFQPQGLDEIWAFRKWLHRRCGRLRPFWQPTFENNLRVLQTGNLTSSIEVHADDYREFSGNRNHIGIYLTDGTWLLRTITSSSPAGEGVTQIGLDTAINIDAGLIRYISFMGLKRLDSDRIEMTWSTNRTLNCVLRLVEIQP